MNYSTEDRYMFFMAAHGYLQIEEIYFETDIGNLFVTAFIDIEQSDIFKAVKWEMHFKEETIVSRFIIDDVTVTAVNKEKLEALNEKIPTGHFVLDNELQRLTFVYGDKIIERLMPSTGSFHTMHVLINGLIAMYGKEIEDIIATD